MTPQQLSAGTETYRHKSGQASKHDSRPTIHMIAKCFTSDYKQQHMQLLWFRQELWMCHHPIKKGKTYCSTTTGCSHAHHFSMGAAAKSTSATLCTNMPVHACSASNLLERSPFTPPSGNTTSQLISVSVTRVTGTVQPPNPSTPLQH